MPRKPNDPRQVEQTTRRNALARILAAHGSQRPTTDALVAALLAEDGIVASHRTVFRDLDALEETPGAPPVPRTRKVRPQNTTAAGGAGSPRAPRPVVMQPTGRITTEVPGAGQGLQVVRPGRPSAGEDGGRVRDYPALHVKVPKRLIAHLRALAVVLGEPTWKVLDRAAIAVDATLPPSDRELVARLTARGAQR